MNYPIYSGVYRWMWSSVSYYTDQTVLKSKLGKPSNSRNTIAHRSRTIGQIMETCMTWISGNVEGRLNTTSIETWYRFYRWKWWRLLMTINLTWRDYPALLPFYHSVFIITYFLGIMYIQTSEADSHYLNHRIPEILKSEYAIH